MDLKLQIRKILREEIKIQWEDKNKTPNGSNILRSFLNKKGLLPKTSFLKGIFTSSEQDDDIGKFILEKIKSNDYTLLGDDHISDSYSLVSSIKVSIEKILFEIIDQFSPDEDIIKIKCPTISGDYELSISYRIKKSIYKTLVQNMQQGNNKEKLSESTSGVEKHSNNLKKMTIDFIGEDKVCDLMVSYVGNTFLVNVIYNGASSYILPKKLEKFLTSIIPVNLFVIVTDTTECNRRKNLR